MPEHDSETQLDDNAPRTESGAAHDQRPPVIRSLANPRRVRRA